MIRIIRIGDQIMSDTDELAIWDTVHDRFVTAGGSQTWDTRADLSDDLNEYTAAFMADNLSPGDNWPPVDDLCERVHGLLPTDWPKRS